MEIEAKPELIVPTMISTFIPTLRSFSQVRTMILSTHAQLALLCGVTEAFYSNLIVDEP